MQITSSASLSQYLSSFSPVERGEPPRTQDVNRAEAQLQENKQLQATQHTAPQVAAGGGGEGS